MTPYTVNGLNVLISADENDINFILKEVASIAPSILELGVPQIEIRQRPEWVRHSISSDSGWLIMPKLNRLGRGYWYLKH
jgi:hypothetical protein